MHAESTVSSAAPLPASLLVTGQDFCFLQIRRESFHREGRAVVVPLGHLATQSAERGELRRRLNPFGHYVETESFGNRDDRTHQGHRLFVFIERGDKCLVNRSEEHTSELQSL